MKEHSKENAKQKSYEYEWFEFHPYTEIESTVKPPTEKQFSLDELNRRIKVRNLLKFPRFNLTKVVLTFGKLMIKAIPIAAIIGGGIYTVFQIGKGIYLLIASGIAAKIFMVVAIVYILGVCFIDWRNSRSKITDLSEPTNQDIGKNVHVHTAELGKDNSININVTVNQTNEK